MECREASVLVHGYLDGELDLRGALDVERHLQSCPACAKARDAHVALRASLRASKLAYEAPASLRGKFAPAAKPAPARSLELFPRLALSFAVLFIAAAGVLHWRSYRAGELSALEAIDAHSRALISNHVFDVASTDQHTVKPWFNGKVDFAPSVEDLKSEDFPLVGGRVDRIAGAPAAALVYKRRKHTITVFTQPGPPLRDSERTVRGFHEITWSKGDMRYWAVSDVSEADLERFVSLLRART